jgi:hypothetical protein
MIHTGPLQIIPHIVKSAEVQRFGVWSSLALLPLIKAQPHSAWKKRLTNPFLANWPTGQPVCRPEQVPFALL